VNTVSFKKSFSNTVGSCSGFVFSYLIAALAMHTTSALLSVATGGFKCLTDSCLLFLFPWLNELLNAEDDCVILGIWVTLALLKDTGCRANGLVAYSRNLPPSLGLSCNISLSGFSTIKTPSANLSFRATIILLVLFSFKNLESLGRTD
jgi:hypothetical protein